jgi:hypothetical protein
MRGLLNGNFIAVSYALVTALLNAEFDSAQVPAESPLRRWHLTALSGVPLTPAILGNTSGGTIRASWGSPEFGYGLGVEQDLGTRQSLNLRAHYLNRSIHWGGRQRYPDCGNRAYPGANPVPPGAMASFWDRYLCGLLH